MLGPKAGEDMRIIIIIIPGYSWKEAFVETYFLYKRYDRFVNGFASKQKKDLINFF